MAQQVQDDFIPDDFVPDTVEDDFVVDDFTPDATDDFTPDVMASGEVEEPGMLGQIHEFMKTPLVGEYIDPNRNMPFSQRFQQELLTPYSLLGEAAGGLGMIAGLRRFNRARKAGQVIDDINISPSATIESGGKIRRGIDDLPLQQVDNVVDDVPININRLDVEDVADVKPVAELGEPIQINPVEKLRTALSEAKPLTVEQSKIYTAERAQRLAQMQDVETPGMEGFRQRRATLGGPYTKVKIEPLSTKLAPEDLDELANTITRSDLPPLQTDNAIEGLAKLYEGQVPQPNQLRLLREVFGGDFNESLVELAGRADRGIFGKTQDFMRAIMTSYDFSAPGRQGKNFISYPEYYKAWPEMFRSWGSERALRASQEAINARPNFRRVRGEGGKLQKSVADRAGLDTTDLVSNREEIFQSRLAERIPGVRMSERAYVGFLNKLRADMFDRLVKEAGEDVLQNDEVLQQIGSFINDATGRGTLGSMQKHAQILNDAFFAPRLHMGKLRLWGRVFNPKFYQNADPVVRKAALRSLITSTGFGLTIGELVNLSGLGEVNNDPTNSDFRKIKIGDTRVDPFGGDQQYMTLMARLLTGQTTSSTSGKVSDLTDPGFGGPTRGSITLDFLANRLAPIPSLAYNIFFHKDYGDEDFGVKSELADKVVPIMVQDIYELWEDDPSLLPLAVPAAFGVGVQSYGR